MKRLLAFGVTGLAAVIATAVLVAPALGTDARQGQAQAVVAGGDTVDLAKAMIVSLRFRTVDKAIAAGYVIDSPCVSDPTFGGMGVHYMNHALANDPAIDAAKPEILVYQPNRNGQLILGAVEYFRRAADQNPANGIDQSDKPTLFGVPFDGVMPAHAPHHGWHYDLHVWIWQFNPSGLFFPFNPTVHCPS